MEEKRKVIAGEIQDLLLNEYHSLLPMKPEDEKRLSDKFMLEFNYNSNHIEGNTLTYGQTKLALFFGKVEGVGNLRDYQEMTAHNVGLKWIKEKAKDKSESLTEVDIRNLNNIILVEDYWKTNQETKSRFQIKVGTYKTRPNSVITATGEEFQYASPEETPSMMYDLIKWLNQQVEANVLTAVELAALFHYRYIRIHPFEDGNGRIARLLMNYILLRSGLPLVIIKSDDKERYLDVLNLCDINSGLTPSDGANASIEHIAPFVAYMEIQLEWSLRIAIKAAKGESIEENDDFGKKLEMLKREAEKKNNKPKRSLEEERNVLECCFVPICKGIYQALKPTEQFFYEPQSSNELYKQTIEDHYIIEDYYVVRRMGYVYELRGAKPIYFDNDFRIKEEFSISFAEDSYSICCGNDEFKQFDYQHYPSVSEIEAIVSAYKASVLHQIEAKIKK